MNPPTSHARFRADLKAFADGELPLFARIAVARHLRGCALCREELHLMKTLSNDLRESDAPEEALSDELRAHILDQVPEPDDVVNEELARRHRRVARKKMVLAFGVCSMVGLIGFSVLRSQNPPQSFSKAADSMNTASDSTTGAASTSTTSDSSESVNDSRSSGAVVGGAAAQAPSAGSATVDRAEALRGVAEAQNSLLRNRANSIFSAEHGSNFADGHVKALPNNANRFSTTAQEYARDIKTSRRSATSSGSAVDSLSPNGAGNPAFQVVPQSRVVHREGSLTVAVQDAETASDNTTAIIKNVGGFVAQASLETGAGQKRTATLDCRVPVEQFELVVQKIGQLGTVRAKSLSGQDITAQVARSGAQRQAWSQELSIAQARLRDIEGAKKRDQYQIAQSRADVRAVRLQAAQARAQLETLRKYGSLSSLYVSLQDGVPVAKTAGWTDSLSPTTRAAWDSFGQNARLPLQLLMWVLAYSPLWLPALLIWRKYGRRWLEA